MSFKISSPLNEVAELKQAIREARKADQLVEQAAMRTFEVVRQLKLKAPTGGTAPGIVHIDKAHDLLGDARFALGDTVHWLEKLLQRAGYTLPAKD